MEFNFDEDMFVTKAKPPVKLMSYNAKICSPLWFESDTCNIEEGDVNRLLYSADYHYGAGQYESALEKYTQLLETLGVTGIKRNVMESVSRCHLQLGQNDKALQYAQQLLNEGTTNYHEIQSLSLLHQIYYKQNKFSEDINILHRLIHLNPTHYLYWLHLAQDYPGLMEETCQSDPQLKVKIFSSYLRALLLLQLNNRFTDSFIRSKQDEILSQTEEKVEQWTFSDMERQEAEKHLSQDLHFSRSHEQMSEDSEDSNQVQLECSETSVSFDQKWFSWSELMTKPHR